MLAVLSVLGVITLGPGANGTHVALHQGDALVVRLPGNATTGYRWAVTRTPPSLHLVRATYVAPRTDVVGSGGTYVFRFTTARGAGTLSLGYRRPWEKQTAPLRTFHVTVRVR